MYHHHDGRSQDVPHRQRKIQSELSRIALPDWKLDSEFVLAVSDYIK